MMRRIEFFDEEQHRALVFLTNNPKLAVATVTEIYKNRWQIELYLKALKQFCEVKTCIGASANALKMQIWTAPISMLLIKIPAMKSAFGWHLSNFMALLRKQLYVDRDLRKWIDDPFKAAETPTTPHLTWTAVARPTDFIGGVPFAEPVRGWAAIAIPGQRWRDSVDLVE